MEEPSVLDYVKSKLTFWKPSSVAIPPVEPGSEQGMAIEGDAGMIPLPEGQTLASEEGAAVVAAGVKPAARASMAGFLLTMGALGSALIAQLFLEPPNRDVTPAAIFYALAALLIGAAYWRSLVLPADRAEDVQEEDSLRFHPEGLAVGLVLMALAFFTFATPNNQDVATFNFINTSLWLLSIGYLVWAFYLPRSGWGSLRSRVARFLTRPNWKIEITGFTLLAIAAIGLVLFFRFYRLNSVPLEPVSDHAEKLLDVNDVLNGQLRVFFPRNTGREAFQFFWSALIAKVFNTGVSFLTLKIGIAIIGLLALYYMYRLGEMLGNRWVGLLAVVFCGFSYWAQTQARIALRFTLYPGFYAPMLFYLIRGLRTSKRNDFIWAGLWMGIGLQGYTSYRIVPFVAVVAVLLYILHTRSTEKRRYALWGLVILALISLAVLMPLFRFTLDRPDMVAFRSLTRVGTLERAIPGSPVVIFFQNLWAALVMFFWDNGDVWVHSIPHRPAMDVITAALFFLGVTLVVLRYLRKRSWVDLFMLVSIPLLLMPSVLSIAFPNENPVLNRTAAAYVPAFLIMALGLEALLRAVKRSLPARTGTIVAWALGLGLVAFSAYANYDLVFVKYDRSMRESNWNSTEMGAVVRAFGQSIGQTEDAWVVPYPYWVDTRLVGMAAGDPTRDMAIDPSQLSETRSDPRNKLFLVNREDTNDLDQLKILYPEGHYWEYVSATDGKNFLVFLAPGQADMQPEGAGHYSTEQLQTMLR